MEHIANARLVDELFVELTESGAIRQIHRVQPAIRDRAAGDHSCHATPARARDAAGGAVPCEPWFQLHGDVCRILAAQHRERFVERLAGQSVIWVRASYELVERRVSRTLDRRRGNGNYRLRQNIERILGDDRRFDLACAGAIDDRQDLDEIIAKRGDECGATDVADRVSRAAGALDGGGDPFWTLDLYDEVDGTDVDAQLERARCHECGQLAGFEGAFECEAAFFGNRSVIGSGDVFLGERVDLVRDALGLTAIVHEYERGAGRADQADQLLVDRGPDGAADVAEVGHGRLHDEIHRLDQAAVDDRHWPEFGGAIEAAEVVRDLRQRALRGGEANALWRVKARAGHQRIEAFQCQREMRAAFAAGDRVDLVDDDRADARKDRAASLGRQQISPAILAS